MDPVTISAATLFAYFYLCSSHSPSVVNRRYRQIVPNVSDEPLSDDAMRVKATLKTLQNQIEQYMDISQHVLSDFDVYYQRYVDAEKHHTNSDDLLRPFLNRVVCALKEIDVLMDLSCELDMSDDDLRALSEMQLHEKEELLKKQIQKNKVVLEVEEDIYDRIRNVGYSENKTDYDYLLSFVEERCSEFEIEKPTLLKHLV